MSLADLHSVHINPALEPTLAVFNLHIIPAHLPLPHQTILSKRPVLQSICAPPLARLILPLVPKLHSDLRGIELSVQAPLLSQDDRGTM